MELIATDAQKLSMEPKIHLFQIDATSKGQGILYFTPAVNVDLPVVSFGGFVYQRLPIQAEGFEWTGTGTAPRPTLTLQAMDLLFLSLIVNSDDLVGCPVQRIVTHRKYLDDGVAADPAAHYPIDYYQVNKKNSQKRQRLQFELATPMDQAGRQIPARQVIRDTCQHRFRYWANGQWNYNGVTCPYAGAAMYEPSGQPTSDPTKAKCGKRVSDCARHFGKGSVLPMFAFPGVGRLS
jgi:lambda family phage minor tail protein L